MVKLLLALFFGLTFPNLLIAAQPNDEDLFTEAVIISGSARSFSDINGLFTEENISRSGGEVIFPDFPIEGYRHEVTWKTPTPVRLDSVKLRATPEPYPHSFFDPNKERPLGEFKLYYRKENGQFAEIVNFIPSDQTSAIDVNFQLLEAVEAQRFKAEFVQVFERSGPRVIELDGFGEKLEARTRPTPVRNDIWDVSQGSQVLTHSPIKSGLSATAENLIGGDIPNISGEDLNTVFAGGEPESVHFVEWKTKEPIQLEQFNLFAYHDQGRLGGGPIRDRRNQGFSEFRLLAEVEGEYQKVSEYFTVDPYAEATNRDPFVYGEEIEPIIAQKFRAEFVQTDEWPPTYGQNNAGSRVVELDGFGIPVSELEPDPVVLVPGMFTSYDSTVLLLDDDSGGDQKWRFFPIRGNVYRGLIERLEQNGFIENENLFIAHYDWRQPVAVNSLEYLMPVIEEAAAKSRSGKVDVLAHSMGGLLARSYVQSENLYRGDVDQLITLGTPHLGAPDAYVAWEGGEFPTRWENGLRLYLNIVETVLSIRSLQGIEPDRPRTTRRFFPSLRDLLPVGDEIIRDSIVLKNEERVSENSFLNSLRNRIEKITDRGIELTSIAGSELSTLTEIQLQEDRDPDDEAAERWRDGSPNPEEIPIEARSGDQTVPLTSALMGSDTLTIAGAKHDLIPEEAQDEVLEILGISPLQGNHIAYARPESTTGIVILSPVEPVLIGPNNEILSRTTNTFSDGDFIADEDPMGVKLLTLGDPPPGSYQLELTGTGDGEFHVVLSFADKASDSATFVNGETVAEQFQVIEFDIGASEKKVSLQVLRVEDVLSRMRSQIKVARKAKIIAGYERANLDRYLKWTERDLRDYHKRLQQGKEDRAQDEWQAVIDNLKDFEHELTEISAVELKSELSEGLSLVRKLLSNK